jgi:predicted peptidase
MPRLTHLFALALLCPVVLAAQKQPPVGEFVRDSVVLKGRTYPYAVYLPVGYSRSRAWPMILGLHGPGSRGDEGILPQVQSLATAARLFPTRYPAILVLPQCPIGEVWLGPANDAAWAALQRARRMYPTDSTRIYLAGQAMGADGGFLLAGKHPNEFAAFLAVAVGWGDAEFDAAALKTLPIRVFHSTTDRVPIARARAIVARLHAAHHPDVQLREYPNASQPIFDTVYRDSTVSEWLFKQHRVAR